MNRSESAKRSVVRVIITKTATIPSVPSPSLPRRINGRKIVLEPFIQQSLAKAVKGYIDRLINVPGSIEEIELRITVDDESSQ